MAADPKVVDFVTSIPRLRVANPNKDLDIFMFPQMENDINVALVSASLKLITSLLKRRFVRQS